MTEFVCILLVYSNFIFKRVSNILLRFGTEFKALS